MAAGWTFTDLDMAGWTFSDPAMASIGTWIAVRSDSTLKSNNLVGFGPQEDMDLDLQICSRARLSRDPRFDGKFFIAVRGSKVYCRSICPAPTAKEKNCRYYPSAAAAQEAGYRPCLRCRPESSPGTPAWLGTSSTVSRALRLIGESGLGDGGVEVLAERLGVGSRHLRRLFLRHLGATPIAVAQTRRMHFAKKLIDETSLPMNQIALAAGFGSVRRFNEGVLKVYHRTPTQIRRLARQTGFQPGDQYCFRLHFRPPYHWQGMLDFLAPRATPGVEIVDAGIYRRTISLNGRDGYFEVSFDEPHDALLVRIEFGDPQMLYFIVERIRAMFDLNADWASIVQNLKSDSVLAERMEADAGLRVPGCWNGFELAIRAILGQQITVKAATTLAGRIASSFGKPFCGASGLTHIFPSPEVLANAKLTRIGLPAARAETIQALARAVCAGRINFVGVVDSDAFLNRLCEIPGIGKWTAQYVAMRALGEPDAFPSTDLGLLRATVAANSRELEHRAEAWRPWRAYAAMYLWRMLSQRKSARDHINASQYSEVHKSHFTDDPQPDLR
jgi:AraC family transcriptional regulator, regulatory protein of adaptative response / DNA-3-methyladenine glycosylase II